MRATVAVEERSQASQGERVAGSAAGSCARGAGGGEERAAFVRLGEFLVRRRKAILVVFAVVFAAAGVYGGDVAAHLSTGGFADPDAESTRAEHYLSDTLGSGNPNVVVVVRPVQSGATVDDPAVAAAGQQLVSELAAMPGVGQVTSYWALGSPPPLRSDAADSALVLAYLEGDDDQVSESVGAVADRFDGTGPVIATHVGGLAEAMNEVGLTIENDLRLAEAIALPLTLLVLLFVFRSVVAALLPLVAGGFAIVATFVALKALAGATTVSIFSLNLTTAMGLGLAIDYSLFVVSRYREEREKDRLPDEAVVATIATAGRSVVFSGSTVAISMSALLVFPNAFLRSFAYAGIPVVAMAVVGSVVIVPALVAMLGDRIDSLAVRGRRGTTSRDLEHSFWYRTATAVMRRPLVVAGTVTLALVGLATPFLHIELGFPDDRVLPASATSREVGDTLRAGYDSKETGALSIVFPDEQPSAVALDAYATSLSAVAGVARVDSSTGIYVKGARVLEGGPVTQRFSTSAGRWLSVVPAVEPASAAAEALVHDLREVVPPDSVSRLVGGTPASVTDTKEGIVSRLPYAIAIVALATFVLLFLTFGSLLVPAKALVLNTLSLTATFGAMVWVFQDGHLSSLLGFTATGTLVLTIPILMFCIAFGMSMDYEVFLLSRIKEEHDRTGDNTRSVAVGLARTGRIITAAAVTIAIVFLAFATSSVSFIKLFGLGLAIAVVMDATVIRATLVPAFMGLAGEANWWAPRWMRRLSDRAGLGEVADVDLRGPSTSDIDVVPAHQVIADRGGGDAGRTCRDSVKR